MGGLKPSFLDFKNYMDLHNTPPQLMYLIELIYNNLEDVYSVGSATELQEAVDNIGTEAGTIFIEAGTHVIDTPIDIDGGGSVVIYGHGDNTILQADDGISVFNITDCASCIIKNLQIDATAYTGATSGIIIDETNDNVITIEDVSIVGNNLGTGIELISDNCIIEHCNISQMNDGIFLNNSNRNIIAQNIVSNNARYGINLNTVLYCNIGNNTCNSNLTGIYALNSTNNSISNNICNLNTEHGIYTSGSSYNTISGNTCENNDSNTVNDQAGIYISNNSDFNIISGNSLNNNNNAGVGDGYGLVIATATCEENVVASNNANGNDIDWKDVGARTVIKYYVQSGDELQDAIDSIGTGAGTVIMTNGTLSITIVIDVDGGGDYVIMGEGVGSILETVGDISCFNITDAKSCVLRDFKIDASSLTTATKEIITVDEINDNKITIQNITVVGHAVNQNGYGINFDSNNCEIKNCYFEDMNYGIVLTGASYCEISNNFFDDIKTIDISLSTASNWNLITSNIHLNGNQVIVLNASTYNNINSNNMSTITTRGINLTNNSDFCTVSNNIINASKNGIRLDYSDQCIVSGNIIRDSVAGSEAGIYIYYSNQIIVDSNYICSPLNAGVRIYHSNRINITSNFCYYGASNLISGNDSDNVNIIGNYGYNCGRVVAGGSFINIGSNFTNASITGNKIGGTTRNQAANMYGIFVSGFGVDDILISSNFIFDIVNNGAGDAIGIYVSNDITNLTLGLNFLTGVNTPYTINATSPIILGDDTIYGAGWDTDLGTATKNAIYDKMELVIASIPTISAWYIASDDLIHSNDIERTKHSDIYVKVKEITSHIKGNIKVYWEHKHDGGADVARTRLYINGVAVGTAQDAGAGYTSETEDISVELGDLIQIYGYAWHGIMVPDDILVKNMRIKYADFVNTPLF